MSEVKRFPYPGAIDADGHVLEPPDIWEKYIDPEFRDRAIRVRRRREDGLEVLEIDQRPSKYMTPGGLGSSGAMGKSLQVFMEGIERTGAFAGRVLRSA